MRNSNQNTLTIDNIDRAILNDPETIITTKIVSVNITNKTAHVILQAVDTNGQLVELSVENAFIDQTLWTWLTAKFDVKDEHGNVIGSLTNFQKFLISKQLPLNSKVTALEFTEKNCSSNYKNNPFCLKLNSSNNWTIKLITTPSRKRIVEINPNNNQEMIRYESFKSKNGYHKIEYLGKAYYKRCSINETANEFVNQE